MQLFIGEVLHRLPTSPECVAVQGSGASQYKPLEKYFKYSDPTSPQLKPLIFLILQNSSSPVDIQMDALNYFTWNEIVPTTIRDGACHKFHSHSGASTSISIAPAEEWCVQDPQERRSLARTYRPHRNPVRMLFHQGQRSSQKRIGSDFDQSLKICICSTRAEAEHSSRDNGQGAWLRRCVSLMINLFVSC